MNNSDNDITSKQKEFEDFLKKVANQESKSEEISNKENSGDVTLNVPAARKVQKGDPIIIISYAQMSVEEAKSFKPVVVFPNEETNKLS